MPNENEQITLGLGIDTSKAEQDIDTFVNNVNKKVASVNGKITFDTKSLNKSITKAIDTKSISQSITQAVEDGVSNISAPDIDLSNLDWGNLDFDNLVGKIDPKEVFAPIIKDAGALSKVLESLRQTEPAAPVYDVNKAYSEGINYINAYETQVETYISQLDEFQKKVDFVRSAGFSAGAMSGKFGDYTNNKTMLKMLDTAEDIRLARANVSNRRAETLNRYPKQLPMPIIDVQSELAKTNRRNKPIDLPNVIYLTGPVEIPKTETTQVDVPELEITPTDVKTDDIQSKLTEDIQSHINDIKIDEPIIELDSKENSVDQELTQVVDENEQAAETVKKTWKQSISDMVKDVVSDYKELGTNIVNTVDKVNDTLDDWAGDIDLDGKLNGFFDPRNILKSVKNMIAKESVSVPISVTSDPSNTKLRNVRGIDDPNKLHFENLKDPSYLAAMQALQVQIDKITQSITKQEIAINRVEIAHRKESQTTSTAITRKTSELDKYQTVLNDIDAAIANGDTKSLEKLFPTYAEDVKYVEEYYSKLSEYNHLINQVHPGHASYKVKKQEFEQYFATHQKPVETEPKEYAEYQDLLGTIERLKAELENLKTVQQLQHDNYVKNIDAENQKLEEQKKLRGEYVEKQEDTTHKALAGEKIEAPKESDGDNGGDKTLATLEAVLGKLGQVKSLSGAVSTVMMLLPEPLTTTLGLIMKVVGAFGIFKVVLAPIQKLLNGILGKVTGIAKGVTGTGNIFEKVFSRIMQRLKSMLFYNVISSGINKLRNELTQLLKTDAQVKTSLGQIKGNLMTAFAPIYTFVLPAIQRLLQALVTLSSLLARLSMGIFGKTAKESQGLAKSLEEQAKAGGGASNSLGHLDELNTDIAQGGGGGAGDIQSLYDGLKVSEELEALGERVRAMLLKFWQPFKESWDTYAQPTWEKIKTSFFTFADVGLSVGESFADAWANGFGESILGHLWRIFGNIIDTFTGLVSQFGKAWDVWGDDIAANFFTILDTLLVHIENISASIKEWAENINFEPLLSGVNDVLAALAPFSEEIGSGLEWFVNNVLLPLGTWIIEKGLPALLRLVAAGILYISNKIKEFKQVFEPAWDEWIKPLCEAIGQQIIDIIDRITDAMSNANATTETGSDDSTVFQKIIQLLIQIVVLLLGHLRMWLAILQGLIELILGAIDVIKKINSWINNLKDTFSLLSTVVGTIDLAHPFRTAITVIENAINAVKTFLSLISEGADVGALISSGWEALTGGISDIWSDSGASGGGTRSYSGTKGSSGGTGGRITNTTGVPTSAVVAATKAMEEEQKKVKKKSSAGMPSNLPRAATGTVVPPNVAPYLAVLGDNNQETEVVSPLSTMKQAMIEALQESGANGGSEVIQLSMDGDVLFKWIVEKNRQNYLQTHNNSLVY